MLTSIALPDISIKKKETECKPFLEMDDNMNLIAAADNKWGIGKDGGLLAHLPGDMKYFREKTAGKVVVMGRKTLESLPGGCGLPNRTNYVLTSNSNYEAEHSDIFEQEAAPCHIVNTGADLMEELAKYEPDDVFLIGGAAIYNSYYKLCDRLYVTKIDADLHADTFITNFDEDCDFEIESESEPITENGITYRFVVYKKR